MASDFTSQLSKQQAIAVLIWFPMHMVVLPLLLTVLMMKGLFSDLTANLLVYAIGAAYMLLVLRRFFRRDFDALCDRPLLVLFSVVGAYWLSRFGGVLIALLLEALSVTDSNGNNDAVIEMAKANPGPTAALAVILAPIVEESLFRAGIFGLIRRKSRFWAYAVSILVFGLYHVWQGALLDPRQLFFVLQYVPASFALAYIYERTNSIWSSVFLHMLINGISTIAVLAA